MKESELRTSKVTFLKFGFDGWVDDDNCIVSNETRYTEKDQFSVRWRKRVHVEVPDQVPSLLPLLRAELFRLLSLWLHKSLNS